jgi:CRISPR-associated endoribonuclease Cas6
VHPWAGTTSFEKIWDRARENHPPQEIHLEFATPATFKSSGNWIPLPHPILLFGSLVRKWVFFAPNVYHTPPELEPFIEYMLPLNVYDCWSESVRGKNRKNLQGFMGNASYNIRSDEEAQTALKDALQQSAEVDRLARQIRLLADFAFYSGIGSKTAMGMGMVRQIKG